MPPCTARSSLASPPTEDAGLGGATSLQTEGGCIASRRWPPQPDSCRHIGRRLAREDEIRGVGAVRSLSSTLQGSSTRAAVVLRPPVRRGGPALRPSIEGEGASWGSRAGRGIEDCRRPTWFSECGPAAPPETQARWRTGAGVGDRARRGWPRRDRGRRVHRP